MRLNEIHAAYKDQIQFELIYIHEAHPSDGWQTPQNLYDGVIHAEPTNDDERAEVAHACRIALELEYPLLIDGIDNAVEEAYVSSPIRMFLIDADGIITFTGGQGPRDFRPDDWEAAIKEMIAAG